jgi:hypothetical protein
MLWVMGLVRVAAKVQKIHGDGRFELSCKVEW